MEGENRNYGIDLLRVLSMFFVILLHCLGRGGVLNFYKQNEEGYFVFWFFEAAAYCAVDIFGLISGYVGYSDKEKPFKIKNYINIWLQTVFFGLAVDLVFQFVKPESVSYSDYLKSLFPVSNDLYWYLTAYTALYFFMPVLNAAVRGLDEKRLKKLLLTLFIVFSAYENLARNFKLDRGYSFAWLALLYFAGAVMKKCGIGRDLKKRYCFILIFLLSALGWSWKMTGLGFGFHGLKVTDSILIAYISPVTAVTAALYLIAFSKLNIKGAAQKIIKVFAPGAFAVYIINCHPLIWNRFMTYAFKPIKESPVPALLGAVLLFCTVFTSGCLIADFIRRALFKSLRIPKLVLKISSSVRAAVTRIKKRPS